jgi:histidyl-tRNA synthetase
MSTLLQPQTGFRDYYPEDCLVRNHIFGQWSKVLRSYGFTEFDGPMVESTELYRKKSGGELSSQLFNFTDKGGDEITLRPELTLTVGRMVIAREAHYKKPIKWYNIGRFFRYERAQKGRRREFYQLNADMFGSEGPVGEAELLALVIDVLRSFGLTEKDFVVRVSDRRAWTNYLKSLCVSDEQIPAVLAVVDKLERDRPESLTERLAGTGATLDQLREFIQNPPEEHFADFTAIKNELELRGLDSYVKLDPGIVRGLNYYTGLVFEVFDRAQENRALAGGGRYDNLLSTLSDGKVSLPALGFGMGDVVLLDLLQSLPHTKARLDAATGEAAPIDVYAVLAGTERRAEALATIQLLREEGFRVDFPFNPGKIGKQFQAASSLGARAAVVFGHEWPQVSIKDLATREETHIPATEIIPSLRKLLGSE